jgi:hypothetical protein
MSREGHVEGCDGKGTLCPADFEPVRTVRVEVAELRDRLGAAEAEVDVLRAALKPFTDEFIGEDAQCHKGIVPMERCARCGPILRARAALGLP